MNLLNKTAYLDAFCVHLVVLLWLGPVKSRVSLFVDKQVWKVHLLELKFDGSNELSRHQSSGFTP